MLIIIGRLIEPNFLSAPEDIADTLKGYKMIRRMLGARALGGWVKSVEHTPGPDVVDDAQLLAALRKYTEVDFHPVGHPVSLAREIRKYAPARERSVRADVVSR